MKAIGSLPPFYTGETAYGNFEGFRAHQVPSEKEYILTVNNLLPSGANAFLLEQTLFFRLEANSFARVASLPLNSIHSLLYPHDSILHMYAATIIFVQTAKSQMKLVYLCFF